MPASDGMFTGAYPIPLLRASVAGFLGGAERGPVNEPVLVRSFAEFYQHFGGKVATSCLAQAVQDYFLHGGSSAIVVRVANRATRGEIRCPAGSDALVFAARYPGSEEVLRVSIDYDRLDEDPTRFNLVVQRLRRGESTIIADQELFPAVSVDPADDHFIVDALRDSRLISVILPVPPQRPDATPPERPGDPIRYIGMDRLGSDGEALTDYDIVGSRSQKTGLFAFDRGPRIDFLCIPPPPEQDLGLTVFAAAERVCAERRMMLVFDPPASWETPEQAIAGARSIASSSRHVFAYYPRIRTRGDRARSGKGLPACGAIAGLLAQRDARGLWEEAPLTLKASLTSVCELTRGQAALLERSGINIFSRGAAGAVVLAGKLFLGSAQRGGSAVFGLGHGRLVDFILNSVEEAVRFAFERLDRESALPALRHQLQQFLGGLHERGVLAGARPDQAYFVDLPRVDADPGAAIRFGFALDRPGEFINAAVVGTDGAQVAKLTAGLEVDRMLI